MRGDSQFILEFIHGLTANFRELDERLQSLNTERLKMIGHLDQFGQICFGDGFGLTEFDQRFVARPPFGGTAFGDAFEEF